MVQLKATSRKLAKAERPIFLTARSAFLSACFLALASCGGGGDPDDGGIIIGTGVAGTVSEKRVLVAERVEVKASSGERTTASLDGNRRFTQSSIDGQAPYLLRIDLGSGQFRYALAFEGTRTNINSYSDVIVRNWFTSNNLNIDAEFSSNGPLNLLPSQPQFDELADRIFSLVQFALIDNQVTDADVLFGNFDANDRDIDEYLDSNPVVVDGQQISVVLTDPDNSSQTSTQFNLTLDTPAGAVDTQSPTTVGNVRALGSSPTQIVVVWDPATDDVGVVGYQVRRDGNPDPIETTPYPVFTDTGLQSGSEFSYTITAIDSSGRLSPSESLPAVGQTLAGPDNLAPPAPVINSVVATTNQITVRWDVFLVPDVVAFNVFRGTTEDTGDTPFFTSTSSVAIDFSVTSGTQFCYRIAAVDAAGNSSSQSNVECATTGGSAVTPGPSNGGNATVAAGGLQIPSNLGALSCDAILDDVIVEDTVLSEPCYQVTRDTTIGSFADVTVEAGTVFRFSQGVGLTITTNASLSVNGTPQSPVVFTGAEEIRGFWRGIHFERASKSANQITNAVIQYAGSGDPALLVTSTVSDTAQLAVVGSVIRLNEGFGFAFSRLGTQVVFDGNQVTGNGRPALLGPLVLPMISANNDLSGNDEQVIDVPSLTIVTDLMIPDLGVPLRSNGLSLERANLTIDAGVSMRFLANRQILIEDGDLIVNGTAADPVTLSGFSEVAGFWGGVELRQSTASRLTHVTIEHGGALVGQSNANLTLVNSNADLDNVTLRRSGGFGFSLRDGSQFTGSAPILIDNLLQ